MDATEIPIDKIKQSMRNTWMAGDFGVVAKTISGGADAFASRLWAFTDNTSGTAAPHIKPGSLVLDVATGTGNLALPLARRGAIVTGVDIAPNLLAQARQRASDEGLDLTFDEGDAEQLPYADATFDAVVTMFGAMFAPRPELVASELARVLKPGGLLGMANWNPAGFSGQMFKVAGRHVPPALGIAPPVLWGDEPTARERLAPFFTSIEAQLIPIDFDMPTSPAGAVAFFRKYFGPTQVAFSRLDQTGQAAFSADLEALWSSANVAPDPDKHTLIRNQYLEITAIRTNAATSSTQPPA